MIYEKPIGNGKIFFFDEGLNASIHFLEMQGIVDLDCNEMTK